MSPARSATATGARDGATTAGLALSSPRGGEHGVCVPLYRPLTLQPTSPGPSCRGRQTYESGADSSNCGQYWSADGFRCALARSGLPPRHPRWITESKASNTCSANDCSDRCPLPRRDRGQCVAVSDQIDVVSSAYLARSAALFSFVMTTTLRPKGKVNDGGAPAAAGSTTHYRCARTSRRTSTESPDAQMPAHRSGMISRVSRPISRAALRPRRPREACGRAVHVAAHDTIGADARAR